MTSYRNGILVESQEEEKETWFTNIIGFLIWVIGMLALVLAFYALSGGFDRETKQKIIGQVTGVRSAKSTYNIIQVDTSGDHISDIEARAYFEPINSIKFMDKVILSRVSIGLFREKRYWRAYIYHGIWKKNLAN